MAIKASDYIKTRERNIKRHKKNERLYLFDFRIDGKRYRKQYKIKATNHTSKDNLKEARLKLDEFKEEIENGHTLKRLRLDELFSLYMQTQPTTNWSDKKIRIYDLYIGDNANHKEKKLTDSEVKKRDDYNRYKIGKRYIDEIKPLHIERIISNMQKIHNLSPRTQKLIVEVLTPIFKYAIENELINNNPVKNIRVKIPSQKKIVTHAGELLKKAYSGIMTYYEDDPYYRALFLFGFTGRRKTEALTLKWENIDLDKDYYWIEDTKNGDKQRYPLPPVIKSALLDIKDHRAGWVFKSPTTNRPIVNIDRQMKKLKEFTGMENLTFHYMRNILVSALSEQGTEAIILSGLLGHKDVNTINKYLSNSTMKSGQEGLDRLETILDIDEIK